MMLPAEAAAAAAAADPMAEAHGLADPRHSDDTAAAVKGVQGDQSHGEDGPSAATAGQKVCNHEYMSRLWFVIHDDQAPGQP